VDSTGVISSIQLATAEARLAAVAAHQEALDCETAKQIHQSQSRADHCEIKVQWSTSGGAAAAAHARTADDRAYQRLIVEAQNCLFLGNGPHPSMFGAVRALRGSAVGLVATEYLGADDEESFFDATFSASRTEEIELNERRDWNVLITEFDATQLHGICRCHPSLRRFTENIFFMAPYPIPDAVCRPNEPDIQDLILDSLFSVARAQSDGSYFFLVVSSTYEYFKPPRGLPPAHHRLLPAGDRESLR
jgi:hypothetical protein